MTTDRNKIISPSAYLESSLKARFDTDGNMFGDLIAELGRRLPSEVVSALRTIASMRAKYAHWSDSQLISYEISGKFDREYADFQESVQIVEQFLNKQKPNERSPQHKFIRKDTNVFSEWIIRQPITGMPVAFKK